MRGVLRSLHGECSRRAVAAGGGENRAGHPPGRGPKGGSRDGSPGRGCAGSWPSVQEGAWVGAQRGRRDGTGADPAYGAAERSRFWSG